MRGIGLERIKIFCTLFNKWFLTCLLILLQYSDLSKAERTETETGTNFAIPLLAKTHLVSSTETTESVTETVTETAAVTEEVLDRFSF